MTNALYHAVEFNLDAAVAWLRSASRFFRDLSRAAETCELNFDWLSEYRSRLIPCLDTDIIVSALFSESASAATERFLNRASLPWVPEFPGPLTVRYHLRMPHRFSLPAGTVAELLYRQRELKSNLGKRASDLVDMIEGAAAGRKGVFPLLANPQAWGAILKRSLHDFVGHVRDLEFMEFVISNSIPIESLYGDIPDQRAIEAFDTVLANLGFERPAPDRELPNYCDALNAACVVRVFNARFGSDEGNVLPILITATEEMLRQERVLRPRLSIDPDDAPSVVGNLRYLTLVSGLGESMGSDRNSPLQITVDQAINLRSQAQHLHLACKRLQRNAAKRQLVRGGAHEWFTDTMRDEFDSLLIAGMQFQENWGHLVARADVLPAMDHADLINRLISPDLEARLSTTDPDQVRRAANELRQQLRQTQRQAGEFGALLLAYATYRESYGVIAPPTMPGLQVTQVGHDGTPLTEIRVGRPVGVNSTNAPHAIRVAVHLPVLAGRAAILILDSERADEGAEHVLRFVWLHKKDAEAIVFEGLTLLRQCLRLSRIKAQKAVYRLFSSEAWQSGEVPLMDENVSISRLSPHGTLSSYIELEVCPFTFLADTEALEEIEFQAGLMLPAPKCCTELVDMLSQSIARSSLFSLPMSVTRRICEEALAAIGVYLSNA